MSRAIWDQMWPKDPSKKIFPIKVNPNMEAIRKPLLQWAINMGIAGSENTIATFDDVNYAAYPAFIYPMADEEGLLLVAQWMAWFFLFDNHIDEKSLEQIPQETPHTLINIENIVSLHHSSSSDIISSSPYAKALADLWIRSRDLYRNPGWEQRYIACFKEYQYCQLWEIHNRAKRKFPDFQTYVENKRCSSASQLGSSFVELFISNRMPDHLQDSFLLVKIRHICGDIIHLATDIISSERERLFSTIPNGISTLQHSMEISSDEAINTFVKLWLSKVNLFYQIKYDLEPLLKMVNGNIHYLKIIDEYLDDLMLWMGGNMEWIGNTLRYVVDYKGDSF